MWELYIDSDFVFSPFAGKVPAHLQDTGFRRIVSDAIEISVRDGGRHAGYEDYTPLGFCSDHFLCRSLGTQKHPRNLP